AILKAAERLTVMPRRGLPGRAAGTRELILSGWPWILVYSSDGDRITRFCARGAHDHVLALRHSARDK
ncbi:MAG: type II toxin-antitoxin system RelE/ParE family toxin, partial [Pseudomonadota bacterium]